MHTADPTRASRATKTGLKELRQGFLTKRLPYKMAAGLGLEGTAREKIGGRP